MAPIPANASAAMLFSFFVAMVIAPWAMLKLSAKRTRHDHAGHGEGRLGALYRRMAAPVVASRRNAARFLLYVAGATVLVCLLFVTKSVTVKLLPFDNKSELAVMIDLPEGATPEDTGRALMRAAAVTTALPEVTAIQAYAGTAAPFNFNGLVRHYYLRNQPELGELAITLADKSARKRESHAIALDLRRRLADLALPAGTAVKVVEVPPGPPVLSTLLAEIYGPDAATRRAVAEEIETLFRQVPYIVDIDDSWGRPRPRLRISIDQDRLEYFGVQESDVYDTLSALLGGRLVGYSHRGPDRDPLEIVVREPKSDLTWSQKLASTPVPANAQPGNRAVVELGEVVRVTEEPGTPVIFRRDGHYADMVTGELAGDFEAPLYGMMAVDRLVRAHDWHGLPAPRILLHGQPESQTSPSLLWDGEWEVTWVTFRDMGAAFMVAILGIYVLVVAQFKSFKLPLVILTPIPLTLIGIVLGHWVFGAPFTATSMIGFIALAGIIVRNSILLVDFIRHGATPGKTLRAALLEAGAIRFRPIVLTALAAMIGAATILTDPIFQGLAISLLFGLASSTLLTVLVIPAIYVWLRDGDAIIPEPARQP
jgi:multidrug efflux pump subunit AcrB